MRPELKAAIVAALDDSTQIRDLTPDLVGPTITELVHLLVHLAARLPDPGAPDLRPEAVVRQDRLLTPDEAAGLLGVSRRWLYRQARDLPFARRLSRKALRFSEAGLNKYLTDRSRRHGSI